MKRDEVVGKKVNRLLVLSWKRSDTLKGQTVLTCRCDCGRIVDMFYGNLFCKKIPTESCGCYRSELFSKIRATHGEEGTKTYRIWGGMKTRCLNTKSKQFKNYGGRGIKVSKAWIDSYETFREDLGVCPPNHSLERIDVNGDYCKENCKWIPMAHQARNRRDTVRITAFGETKTLQEWLTENGLPHHLVRSRIRAGWPNEYLFIPSGQPRQQSLK